MHKTTNPNHSKSSVLTQKIGLGSGIRGKLEAFQILKDPFASEHSWLTASQKLTTSEARLVDQLGKVRDHLLCIAAFVTCSWTSLFVAMLIGFMISLSLTAAGTFLPFGNVAAFMVPAILAQFVCSLLLGTGCASFSRFALSRAIWSRYFTWFTVFVSLCNPYLFNIPAIPVDLLQYPNALWCILMQALIAPLAAAIGFNTYHLQLRFVRPAKLHRLATHLEKEEKLAIEQAANRDQRRVAAEIVSLGCSQFISVSAYYAVTLSIFKLALTCSALDTPLDAIALIFFCIGGVFLLFGYPVLFGLCSKQADFPGFWLASFFCVLTIQGLLLLAISWTNPPLALVFWLLFMLASLFVYGQTRNRKFARIQAIGQAMVPRN